jgi:hypothetical protein
MCYSARMVWLKLIVGVFLGLVGLAWVGQGLNLIKGSFMTGQGQWAVIGVVLIIVAAWLVWSAMQQRRQISARQ